MSNHYHACIIHHKSLLLYFILKDNKIPDDSKAKSFKDFHATHFYKRWTKKRIKNNFSNCLEISFTTSYYMYKCNAIAKKGFNFIYEAHFEALQRHTFNNANLKKDASTEDKLRDKKFIVPSPGYYTFLLPYSGHETISKPIAADKYCAITSDKLSTSSDLVLLPNDDKFRNVPAEYILLIPARSIYEGGLLNQPSRLKVKKCKLKSLTVGSDGWLAHMKEIYEHDQRKKKEAQKEIDADIQWDTTPVRVINEDNAILEDLRYYVEAYNHSITISFNKANIERLYGPDAIMNNRPLK
ncbi:hypothetical protein RhiirC2_782801 [Rhizophagus irregularis]|uniref:DUF8211 domain-containing protein n=1 Tax=Rhizophagus irregularis TaxID=588596 RepID=A0A2N1N283_9GLOM|nr:hypothetical protein RhiirC2_782801 [Rhizophagus irregularis]